MPKQRSYCFVVANEMRGVNAPASWAKTSMREAINLGTGGWFCYFVDGKFKAAAEMSSFLVKLGFENAYEFTKQEPDAYKLSRAALRWRKNEIPRTDVEKVLSDLQQKYARKFESRPLIVAARLASMNPCGVAAATCIDGVDCDHSAIAGSVLDYARRVIRV